MSEARQLKKLEYSIPFHLGIRIQPHLILPLILSSRSCTLSSHDVSLLPVCIDVYPQLSLILPHPHRLTHHYILPFSLKYTRVSQPPESTENYKTNRNKNATPMHPPFSLAQSYGRKKGSKQVNKNPIPSAHRPFLSRLLLSFILFLVWIYSVHYWFDVDSMTDVDGTL